MKEEMVEQMIAEWEDQEWGRYNLLEMLNSQYDF